VSPDDGEILVIESDQLEVGHRLGSFSGQDQGVLAAALAVSNVSPRTFNVR
jgi:hypothetical protein